VPPTSIQLNASERLRYLNYLLTSVSEQTTKDFKLFLGISFDTIDLKKQFEAQLKSFGATIHVFLFSKRQSQFERYKSILNVLRNKKYITTPDQESNTYLSFTDDDDLWAPQRMSVFRYGAEKLHIDSRKPKFIFTLRRFNSDIEEQNFTHWS
jgi:hypothetical protein